MAPSAVVAQVSQRSPAAAPVRSVRRATARRASKLTSSGEINKASHGYNTQQPAGHRR